MTERKRVELYRRLPEIYRIKDEDLSKLYTSNGEPVAAYQLRSYLTPVEDMFSAIHENIESLYHDLFIETCDEWVIPYIGDLMGTSLLSGDEWTLRADVADTIALRRRKGTLGSIELLTFILTEWGVHCVELMENMVWNQHLNHQRPDEGGDPPYSLSTVPRSAPVRGGTVNLRDPSLLSQLNSPFDSFAHVADVRPTDTREARYNLPNLVIYLWRMEAYRVKAIKPLARSLTPDANPLATVEHPQAPFVVRVNIDPVPVNGLSQPYVNVPKDLPEGRPVRLFNTNHFSLFNSARKGSDALNLSAISPRVSGPDNVPGPIPVERISDADIAEAYDKSLSSPIHQSLEFFTDASFTAPQEYLSVESYDETDPASDKIFLKDVGLQLNLPKAFSGEIWPHEKIPRYWTIRGENLCAWERGIDPPLNDREIAIDPVRGRICMGVADKTRAAALEKDLLVTFTYGFSGAVGAHPISYPALPKDFADVPKFEVNLNDPAKQLQAVLKDALKNARVAGLTKAIVIEIVDSGCHQLDTGLLDAADLNGESGTSILLSCPLIIRAADGERPIIELAKPLAFRPIKVVGADAAEQGKLDAQIEKLFVRLEGLYIARGQNYAAVLPLIARAAVGSLEILHCTIDPGGFNKHLLTAENIPERAPLLLGIQLMERYGFADPAEEKAFKQTPEIIIQHTITGALFTDEGYGLCISDSIVESVPIVKAPSGKPPVNIPFAITGATDPAEGYSGAAVMQNVTVLGRVRAERIEGSGVIFKGLLEVFDQQSGCLKFCYFAEDPADPAYGVNRLPPNYACVSGNDARLIFTSEIFGEPAYCQLSLECDPRILEEGPGVDQMGAFNFLSEAHKWRNLRIRFREFMPVGIRPLLIPIT